MLGGDEYMMLRHDAILSSKPLVLGKVTAAAAPKGCGGEDSPHLGFSWKLVIESNQVHGQICGAPLWVTAPPPMLTGLLWCTSWCFLS